MGPLLFLIYINDLHHAIVHSIIHLFADDTNILHFSKDLKSLTKKLNQDLKFLWHWLNANKISLNAFKTEYIIFKHNSKSVTHEVKLSIGGKRLCPSSTIKYFGVYLDANLNWKTQINSIAFKLKRTNGILAKLRHFVPQEVLISAYHALFTSHLNYCCQIWGQPSTSLVNRIRTLQNHALRLMTFSHYRLHASPLYNLLKILKFQDIVTLQNALFLHDISNLNLPQALVDTFSIDLSHAYNTRANAFGLINPPSFNTMTYGSKSIKNHSIRSWNKCQSDLKSINLVDLSRSQLKNHLKKYFFDYY